MADTVSPSLVLVCDKSSLMVSSEVSGVARQLMEMKENSRCSIGFHLLVAGGRWVTVTASPVSFENFCNSFFQRRLRTPLEPPPSEVMSNSRLPGYSLFPVRCHQRRMEATAKAAVSWSTPTFTNPALRNRSYTP